MQDRLKNTPRSLEMIHQIINKITGGIICDQAIIREVNHALDNDLEYTYFNDTKIEIISDKRNEKERVTYICAERSEDVRN